MATDPADPFAVFGLTERATLTELRAARRELAKRLHPDHPGGDGERMQARVELHLHHLVDRPVARHAAHAGEGRRDDADTHMRLALAVEPRLVAGMQMAFVEDFEALGRKGRFELAGHAGFHGHCGTFGGRECEAATQKNSPTKPATIRFVNSCCGPSGVP